MQGGLHARQRNETTAIMARLSSLALLYCEPELGSPAPHCTQNHPSSTDADAFLWTMHLTSPAYMRAPCRAMLTKQKWSWMIPPIHQRVLPNSGIS